ncbi:MAG: hypothetical protein HGJ98_01480 [Desulfosporosinus sp.]|nr:hypothetical protein [Desulfosporosinus sp.]
MNYTNVFDLGGINNWPYKTETTSRPNQLPDITPTNESQKAEAEKVVKPLEQTNLDKVQQPAPTPQLPTKPAPKPTPQINVQIQKMLESINSERAKVGVAPLSTDIKVMEAARMKSEDMVKNNYFSHTSPTYGSPFDMLSKFGVTFQGAAENIAMNSSVEAAHAALMASEGHRKNILNASYSYIGIGITDSPRGKVFVQMFVKK